MGLFDGKFGGFLQNNSDTLLQTGIGLIGGRNASEQAAMGLQGFAQGRSKNRTLNFLKQMNPELAQAVEAGALSPLEAYKTHLEAQKPAKPNRSFQTLPDGTYGFADNNAGTFNPLGQAAKPAGAGNDSEYGLNPQYGVDAQGNPVILQLSKGGTSKQTALPDGITLSKEPIKFDAGTHFVLLDPITRQPIGQIPKDLAGAKFQTDMGASQAEATTALPGAKASAASIAKKVTSLIEDPYLDRMIGPFDSRIPTYSADGARVQSKIDQLKGDAFLEARQMLKGGGAITDFEGKKAEAAIVRMNEAQNETDFKEALREFNDAVQAGAAKLQAQAGGNRAAPSGADPLGIR
ncbi:hypothetical protein P6U16_08750 [Rhizobium sp. 32-5/1]|uniref:hypothetical protein n=1 Tax=Rhizobium sp. 32-5/1 TaxID=3019602 RepID=UPI00240E12C3|nr:hypothetical protein [Rhizobium sp. 32-5/1]WEZ84644.1 hypothetical protein P6U16_08750 [Rhizobium sp. 32-5/1]